MKKEYKKEEKKSEKTGILSFIYIQDIFTLLNAAFGMLSIFFSIRYDFFAAAIFMLVSLVCDYLDGKVGRMMGRSHEFGKELDSLSDLVGFGVAPAVFGYVYSGGDLVIIVVTIAFVLCGALRLARFNVTDLKGEYQGMPITFNGLILPLIYFAMLPTRYYFIIYLISSALMISTIRIKKII